jgi:hypothetical protein
MVFICAPLNLSGGALYMIGSREFDSGLLKVTMTRSQVRHHISVLGLSLFTSTVCYSS